MSATMHSLGFRCLSSLVAEASMESNSTMILATISIIGGVRGISVYIQRRLTNSSMDSSKSVSASKLEMTPLAA
jgi:hypothetical protein